MKYQRATYHQKKKIKKRRCKNETLDKESEKNPSLSEVAHERGRGSLLWGGVNETLIKDRSRTMKLDVG